jgi:hypothetical protein
MSGTKPGVLPLEKLGAFYLGREYDLVRSALLDRPVVYDARDLTTHAVCVGMTGSGKTGLCIDLLEEAALDGVPAIIIDPKGDMPNLSLTFPELRPADFEPWVNVDDARRKGLSVADYAAQVASAWKKGLDDWGQDGERIRRLRESAEVAIFTPGSSAGAPVSILASLKAPQVDWERDAEAARDQIRGTVSALLGLAGVEADPLRSREHILLSTIFEHFWRASEDLDLARLITSIQTPPVRRLGVFDVDTFFPGKERFALTMALNNILAAPGFETWLRGEPLDVGALLQTGDGKPRHSIFYIAHLNDAERMFFTTLLLEQVVSWVRRQTGTTSLRALLYFDEIFGFLPPVADPPSKRPLLTLLKQARAYGLGVMLTTQNPVDLDYKALGNAGTWFIGKLQTERDKARVLDGLKSAAPDGGAALEQGGFDQLISGLGSRVFLLHNVHEDQPLVFQTRWAMSYLRGPLTGDQIRQLREERGEMAAAPTPAGTTPAEPAARRKTVAAAAALPAEPGGTTPPDGYTAGPPVLSPGVEQFFLPPAFDRARALGLLEKKLGRQATEPETALVYEPALLALARVAFVDQKRRVNEKRQVGCLVHPRELGPVIDWSAAEQLTREADALGAAPAGEAYFSAVPEQLNSSTDMKALGRDFADALYHDQRLERHCNPLLELFARPGESAADFGLRARQEARERRDAAVDQIRRKHQRKIDQLESRLTREQQELERDTATYDSRKREELISAGESLIGLFGVFGKRRSSRGLSTAASKRRMTARAKVSIDESKEEIARLRQEMEDLRREIEEESALIAERWSAAAEAGETFPVKPRRGDVKVLLFGLAWLPSWEITHRSVRGDRLTDQLPAWMEAPESR